MTATDKYSKRKKVGRTAQLFACDVVAMLIIITDPIIIGLNNSLFYQHTFLNYQVKIPNVIT